MGQKKRVCSAWLYGFFTNLSWDSSLIPTHICYKYQHIHNKSFLLFFIERFDKNTYFVGICFGKKSVYAFLLMISSTCQIEFCCYYCVVVQVDAPRCNLLEFVDHLYTKVALIIDGSSHMHHMRVLHNTINAAINCTGLLQPKKDKKLRRRCCKIRINEMCSFANKNIIRKYCFFFSFHSQYLCFFMCWQERLTRMRAATGLPYI